ncbi:Fpg/Nei family DNA glycosylase [Shouchella clausii]|jgi:formamidopyrimidine-DNA glycosylase|uniref:Endonuclease VIII n=1 Tax=Shouchella clausii TaxID=79880 RepID=A0A268RWJ7_SHOCL|nr:DNA-formamidopyrimidine glycosylase family protein [Shouchella clausii]PAD41649.1 endonuclease VIII [Bacillus sp. 7520-S]AST94792.1 endonuclease VIII [Shouchella clausii]MBU8597816.1 endonuclease VIII [Shouchella clausii]MCY1106127.1 Fpg/Nei family DNA glycosylase [Shouchella clausii]MEB5474740.1 DNA-formamidopyrimidine glycosylase family protein [Shouchella clausii]
MPEMPEMATYQKWLTRTVVGQMITDVEVNREKSINVPVIEFKAALQHQTVTEVSRRGKQLLFHLASGQMLLLHLMLGGWMHWGTEEDAPDRTKQVILSFSRHKLYFIGLRLGYIHLHDQQSAEPVLAKLGPEASSINADKFKEIAEHKRTIVKAFLTNQAHLSGIGNCYADEICYHAKLTPLRTIDSLSSKELAALHQAIAPTLQAAANAGGYMSHPFTASDRLTGGMNSKLCVYDREGEACFRCGNPIIRQEASKKNVFFCQVCQH